MQNDIIKIREILISEEHSLVGIKGDDIYIADGIGVKPIMSKLKVDLHFFNGYSVADKVIGKAAALLFVLSGVNYVYGKIMSKSAIDILIENGISYEYGELVEYIENRDKTGMCPLEDSVLNTKDPVEAFDLIQKRIELLMKK